MNGLFNAFIVASLLAFGLAARQLHVRYVLATQAAAQYSIQEHQAGLDRRVGHLSMRDVPLERALSRIEAAARVKIRPRWDALKRCGISPRKNVSVSLGDVTVEQAIEGVFARIFRSVGILANHEEIVVDDPAHEMLFRAYPYPFPENDGGAGVNGAATDLLRAITEPDPYWCFLRQGKAGALPDLLWSVNTPSRHRRFARVLSVCSNGTADGGAAQADDTQYDCRLRFSGFVPTQLRVYDVRDLSHKFEFLEPTQTRKPRRFFGDDAIVQAILCDMPNAWRAACASPGVISSCQGRLIVSQTSQNHQRLQQFLSDLRSGSEALPKGLSRVNSAIGNSSSSANR